MQAVFLRADRSFLLAFSSKIAHRLRNVYKPSNVIANTLKQALANKQKLLLTATPLQNSLLELFGLVSFIDEHTFGDLRSSHLLAAGFCNLADERGPGLLGALAPFIEFIERIRKFPRGRSKASWMP
jgi:hypothetical protein